MPCRIKIQGEGERNGRGGWKDRDDVHLPWIDQVDMLHSSKRGECVPDCMVQASLTPMSAHEEVTPSLCSLVNYGQVVN